jgi:hypothetical protein
MPIPDRPQQFLQTEAWLHAERERVKGMTLDWRPGLLEDVRDTRSPQLLGETLLERMQPVLGTLSFKHDLLETMRWPTLKLSSTTCRGKRQR